MKIILAISLLLFFASCKKDKKECPLQTYNVECSVSTPDWEFGGYNTGTSQYTIQAHCPGDAQKMVDDMSYTSGQSYQHCRIIP